jgi:cysteinyl-tRNA synthetase
MLLILSCQEKDKEQHVNYRQEMRNFVQSLSKYAKTFNPDFLVIPQNGQELMTINGESGGNLVNDYFQAIDGTGREDLFYGYTADNEPTPADATEYMMAFLDLAKNKGLTVLVIDYCSAEEKMSDSYQRNFLKGFISFAADRRELDDIPSYPDPIFNENNLSVKQLSDSKNFLYCINPASYGSKQAFLDDLQMTNYDLIFIDLFFYGKALTSNDIESLKTKRNGGSRLIICYLSIGEAEDYRYYWKTEWSVHPPAWLGEENPDWAGNYKIRYWYKDWQSITYGNDSSYLKKIIDSRFDGVYLDLVDAFEYFENYCNL